MSPLERARQALTSAGFAVYRPGEAVGPCKQGYLVVYDVGLTLKTRSTSERSVGVVACQPLGRQAELNPMLREVARQLAALGLKPRGSMGPEAIDEAFRAHTQSIEFTALCSL